MASIVVGVPNDGRHKVIPQITDQPDEWNLAMALIAHND
jgi:hypothetical protein